MRLLAFILIWVSLAVGAVAATTVYSWRVPAEGDLEFFQTGKSESGEPVYAVLAADAGLDPNGGPVVAADTDLTPEIVGRLQAADVERVRVKSINLGRWSYLPHFIAACVGLVAGGMLTRLSAARDARQLEESAADGDVLSPDDAMRELRAVVRAVLDDVANIHDEDRICATVTLRVGRATRDLVPSLVDVRERLVARMGLGGYAAFMDAFASAERVLNRSWSAAADGAVDESIESLEIAAERLAIAEERLTGESPSLLPLG